MEEVEEEREREQREVFHCDSGIWKVKILRAVIRDAHCE